MSPTFNAKELQKRALQLLARGRRGAISWGEVRHAVLVLTGWCAVIGVIGVCAVVLYARTTIPDPASISQRKVKESTKVYDHTGTTVLYDIYDEERRTVVSYDQMSENIREATVAVEDSRFYEHNGFDIKGFLRALFRNVQRGYGSGGGSTITQQLVGNALVGRQESLFRKIQELLLALEVERKFSKDQILEMYLNQIPYGSNAYGIEAAAQTYFAVPASDLSIAQAATLAALPQRPSYLSPFGSHGDELIVRKDFILTRMHELGMITDEEFAAAKTEAIVFKEKNSVQAAPHFVIMARDYVVSKYGEAAVENGGFKIITTLDAELQKKAEELVKKYAAINKQKYKATNASLVAIDPSTGHVRALIGSANYFDIENEGNFNVALSPNRQPGSSFKPFAYAVAFQKGYPDSTILWDVRTEFNPACPPDSSATRGSNGTQCYHPQNYNNTYMGPVTMRQSLARSLNTTSVQTLYLAGIPETIDLATKMGITTLGDRDRFGLSLVLGGAEVRPIDMVSAYGVFANEGTRMPWHLIQRIEASDGSILEEHRPDSERVLDAQTARLVTDVLADNNARSSVFGVNNSLVIPGREVAAKTGTTQENKDAWVVGYTPSLSVGVWVGNNRGQGMSAAGAGISAAGPLWHDFMVTALRNTPVETFVKPDPVIGSKPMLDGHIAPPYDSQRHSILFYVNRTNPTGPIPSNPASDPQFTNWEWAVQNWNGLF